MRWAFWKRGPSELVQLRNRVDLALDSLDRLDIQQLVRDGRKRRLSCGAFLLSAVEPPTPLELEHGARVVSQPSSIISSVCQFLEPGEVFRASFQPQLSVPKGSWVVAWGPCNVLAVTVGTRAQDIFPESIGPAAVLSDAAFVGSVIGFTLRAWEYPPC